MKNETGTLYYTFPFEVALSEASIAKARNPDKVQLRVTVLDLHAQGMSYRQIALNVGLHWTRVQQIVKSSESDSN